MPHRPWFERLISTMTARSALKNSEQSWKHKTQKFSDSKKFDYNFYILFTHLWVARSKGLKLKSKFLNLIMSIMCQIQDYSKRLKFNPLKLISRYFLLFLYSSQILYKLFSGKNNKGSLSLNHKCSLYELKVDQTGNRLRTIHNLRIFKPLPPSVTHLFVGLKNA